MKNGEKGQALPIALLIVAVGTLVITPFLGNAGTSLLGSRMYGQAIGEQYACDSGVEHAIWSLTNDGLAEQLSSPGDSTSYQLSEAVNGAATNITVSNSWETIASDDFESGGWSGGSGWLYDWYHEGEADIVTTGSPYEGSYHLLLTSGTGYVRRAVDLFGLPSASLQFQAKARSLESRDSVSCLISSNGTDWTTVYTWRNGDDDNNYHPYDIDLSPYTLSDEFWIAFEANMSSSRDYFYVDDLKVVWTFEYAGIIASDDFESGDWSGGSGWLYDWYHEGEADIVTTGSPYEGSYHLLLTDSTGYVRRAVDLFGLPSARLQFQAKARSLEGKDSVRCRISSNGTDWTTVYTWRNGDDDNNYHPYDIDLSPYTLSDEFWIAFDSGMSSAWDFFYVDDLCIKAPIAYGITAIAGDRVIRAVVRIRYGVVTTILWHTV